MNKHKAILARGFTTVELLVTLAIIGIVAAVAVPSYTASVDKGRRAEGMAYILQVSSALERYSTMNNTYTASFTDLGLKAYSGTTAASSAYTYAISAGASGIASSFTVTATAVHPDTVCSTLTVDQAGARGQSGTGSSVTCWGN